MVIAVNLFYHIHYERLIVNSLLRAALDYPEVRLWFPRMDAVEQPVPRSIDGVIGTLNPMSFPAPNQSTALVNVNSNVKEGTVQVCSDNAAIVEMALDHFKKLGLDHLGFLSCPGFAPSPPRLGAFHEICRSKGIQGHVLELKDRRAELIADPIFVESLRLLPKPAGILLPSDLLGAFMIRASRQLGFSVPGELNIVGIDNLPKFCLRTEPALSSVSINEKQIGAVALSTAVALIKGETVDPVQHIPPVELVQRESTRSPQRHSAHVAKALDVIHRHLSEDLQMEDIVAEQPLGRRALEAAFRSEIGESPMAYLREMRLKRVELLLKTTDLQVAEIGRQCGILDASYFGRLFREQYGLSPQKFRDTFLATVRSGKSE